MTNVLLKHPLASSIIATKDSGAPMNQVMPLLAMMTQNLHILTLTSHHDEQHHDHSAQSSQTSFI